MYWQSLGFEVPRPLAVTHKTGRRKNSPGSRLGESSSEYFLISVTVQNGRLELMIGSSTHSSFCDWRSIVMLVLKHSAQSEGLFCATT